MKKLYLISQEVNNNYDTYDSAVVCAKDKEKARLISPGGGYSWCDPKFVKVKEIGVANDKQKIGVILASYNAG